MVTAVPGGIQIRGWSRRHRGACLGAVAGYGVVPLLPSRDKLLRAMLSCLPPPAEKAGYMVKSVRLIPTNMVLPLSRIAAAENDTVTLNEEKSEVRPGRKDMTPNAPWRRLACGASLLGERP